jgi:hypothetical protein
MDVNRLSVIISILAAMFLGIFAANAQISAELPQFKSGASVMMGVPVDFNILNQRVGAIYDVVESNDSHIVWKFTGSTGDWAFVFADGRIVVASTVDFNLAAKDTLTNELNGVMDILNAVNADISAEARKNAFNLIIYYASGSGIYHELECDFGSNLDYSLVVPNCAVKDARLTVTGCDRGETSKCFDNYALGQYYYIDDQEVASCTSYDCSGCCYIPPNVDITRHTNTGTHKISAKNIDNPHTIYIEVITSPTPPKNFVLYGPSYVPWINETIKSMDLQALQRIIKGQFATINTSETIRGEVIGMDLTNLPNVKLNVFLNITNMTTDRLKTENFTVRENNKDIPIDSVYFTGNATGQQIDLAVVFDNTTSMEDQIRALKLKVKDLTKKINSSNLDARYSLVTFNGAAINTEINWTDDTESYQKAVGKLSVSGGNIDLPENSLEGIERALSFGFRPDAQKFILIVTDEPSLQKGDGKSNSTYAMEDVKNDLLNSGVALLAISPDFSNPNANPDVPASDLPRYADMRDLVNQTSGSWIDIRSADFSALLEQIQGILTGTHVIKYTSPDPDPSENRTILVLVNVSVSLIGSDSNLTEVNIESP